MSRARLLKPGFFVDAQVGRVSRDSRLALGGIWTECDDQGYFEWKPEELAWTLFRYDTDKIEVLDRALGELTSVGLVERLACGIHGLIDSMPEHRIQGGNHSSNFERQHQRHCLSGPVRTRQDTPAPARRPGVSLPVRTDEDTVLAGQPVRTSPDESLSESVSDSLKGRKKNVLEEGVVGVDEAREPAAPVEPTPHLSRPVVEGRPNASSKASSSSAVTVPPRLEAMTPKWRGGPCPKYSAHQNQIRIVDGMAVCDACEAERAATAASKPNGVELGAQELGL